MDKDGEVINVSILGKLWLNLMDGDDHIRLEFISGYQYKPTGVDDRADALLWLTTAIREAAINPEPLTPTERLIGTKIGRFVGEVGHINGTNQYLTKVKIRGFDSPACDHIKGTTLHQLLNEFTVRAHLHGDDGLQPSRFAHRTTLVGSIFYLGKSR